MEGKKQVGIWIRVSTDLQVKDDSPEHHEQNTIKTLKHSILSNFNLFKKWNCQSLF